MTPETLFTEFLSRITGGIIPDLGTAMLAGVGILAVILGFDLLMEWFEISLENRRASDALGDAQAYAALRSRYEEGSFDYDYYNAMYRAKLNEGVSVRSGKGVAFSPSGSFGPSSPDLTVDFSSDPGRFEYDPGPAEPPRGF